ncbi:GNAT family N-acetyltransferase [Neptunicella marina]|uniref:GNAT family N-acetyltransferase n=2 Tax=Neptunicella marina TaxID=2125989 RepID=A0A8J6M3I6_9ALTE|nr:GNAT family N-acetyltransferase [Neptunicella marina]
MTDLIAYQQLRLDKKFARFYCDDVVSKIQSEKLLNRFIAQANAQPRVSYQFAIEHGAALVGSVGLRRVDSGCYSFGIELGREAQWKGIAFNAASMMMDFAFNKLGAQVVFAQTFERNVAAIKLGQRLNMQTVWQSDQTTEVKGITSRIALLRINQNQWKQHLATNN